MSFPRPRSMTRVRYVVRVWTEWTTACPRRQRPQTHPLSDPSPRRGRPSEPRSPGCTHTLLRFFKRHSHLSQRRRQHFHWSINKDHPVLLYKNEPLATRRDISVMYSCLQEALSFILIKATLPPTPCYLCGGRVQQYNAWWLGVMDVLCPCFTGAYRLANMDDSDAQTPGT